jgi:hypothetical protein
MGKYIAPTIKEDKLGSNPFLKDLSVPVNKVKSEDRFKQDGEEWYKGEYEFDADVYCKVFSDSTRRKAMAKLSARGKDLLLWLIYEADKGKGYLWINKDRYMQECGITSMNTYRSALNDLLANDYLIRSAILNVFWINPSFFFNGNRIKAFPENVKVK